MNLNTVLEIIQKRPGQIVTMKTARPMKVRKGQAPIEKLSHFQCRMGVNYDNIKKVKEGREDGTLPEENTGLPWGTWHTFPYVIEHKGEYYIRCTIVNNAFRKAPEYFRDGVQITKEEAKVACLASEFKESIDMDVVFNIKLSPL